VLVPHHEECQQNASFVFAYCRINTEAVLFAIAFFEWIASEIIGAMIIPRLHGYRAGTRPETKDRRSGMVVLAGLITAIYLAFGLSLAGIALLPGWLFYPGIALPGGFFSALISVSRKGRPSSKKGPYRYVRHPSHTVRL
jgi:hypothetical protein